MTSSEVPKSKKRVVFCTYSSVYSSIVLNRLLNDSQVDVVAVINSTRVFNPQYGFIRGAIEQIRTSGWKYSSYLFLITDFAKLARPSLSVQGLAKKHQLPIVNTADINSQEALEFIHSKSPEIMLAAHFNQLVKEPLLALDWINIHPSLLPEFKGVDPVFYALLKNKKTGVSLHRMVEKFDEGEVLLQKESEQKAFDTVFSVNCQLFDDGAGLALNWINQTTSEAKILSDDTKGSYDSWPNKEHVGSLRRDGKRLINLSQLWRKLYEI